MAHVAEQLRAIQKDPRGIAPGSNITKQVLVNYCHALLNQANSFTSIRSKSIMGLFSRRQFLAENAMGIGSLALTWLLQQEQGKKPKSIALAKPHNDLLPRKPHFESKPKR